MAVTLKKGQRVSLEKVAPGLSEVFVGLGWDVKATDTGRDFDLDSSVVLQKVFKDRAILTTSLRSRSNCKNLSARILQDLQHHLFR